MNTDHRIARRYARRVPWVDERDLHQEVAIASLLAARSFDPTRGSWSSYAATASYRACRRWLLATGSPVSGARGRERRLAGTVTVPLDERISDDVRQPDVDMAREEWLAAVRAELTQLADSWVIETIEQRSAVLAVARDVPVETIYRARETLRRRVRASTALRALWEER